jgi:two-component system sensor histidine kinase AtoS
MNKTFLRDSLSIFRQPNLNNEQISALLDLIPHPCLLLDTNLKSIIAVNARILELTAFTRTELTKIGLDLLLRDWEKTIGENTNEGHKEFTTSIRTRSGASIDILLTSYPLDNTGKKLILTLEPIILHQLQEEERQRQIRLLDDLDTLIHATQESDLYSSFACTLEIGGQITGASILAIYLNDAQLPGLRRIAGRGEVSCFPERIQAEEVSNYFEISLWIPGKRSVTTLQKAARVANLAYLATAPLGQSKAFLGIITIADLKPSLANNGLKLLKILASLTTTIIQHHAQTSNINESIKKQKGLLAINEAIKENIQDGLIVINTDFVITEMNSSAEWTLGYASQEVCGQTIDNLLIGAENLSTALHAAKEGIETPNLGDIRLHRRDGSTFSARLQVVPVIANEQIQAILIILRDLSEQEQYRTKTQQLEHRAILGEFNAIFAHEVRNPINNITTGLQWMALNLPPDDPNQKTIAELRQDCQRLSHLMQSALAFSRPTEYKMEIIDVGELIQRLLDRWRPRLARENIQHSLSISCDKPCVLADASHLERVFINLISNAADAMSGQGGHLSINIQKSLDQMGRNRIEISVCDNGIGIPQENLEHIFEPYFTTNRNGTGLGLAIVKRIVTDHKGTIQVSSIPGGTVFKVTLPEAQNAQS